MRHEPPGRRRRAGRAGLPEEHALAVARLGRPAAEPRREEPVQVVQAAEVRAECALLLAALRRQAAREHAPRVFEKAESKDQKIRGKSGPNGI